MAKLKDRAWYANQAGTRYVRDKPKQRPTSPQDPETAKHLIEHLKESEGDIELAMLLALRNILAKPGSWNPHRRSVGISGETDPTSPHARSWNLFGAIVRVTTPGLEHYKRELITRIKASIPKSDADSGSLMHWEPEQQHSKILWVLNMSVAARKKELGYI